MCVIISRCLHVYFTTFDMTLKYILTYSIYTSNVLVYILILFCLKNVLAYLWNNDNAARWLIARGLGGIYIFPLANFEKMEQDTRVWEYILNYNINFLHKNNVVFQPALAMGLGGICIMKKNLGKWHNMVSWDVYSDIIMPLKFFIFDINIIVL